MATDDGAVLLPGQDRLDEAELTEAPGQGVEFLLTYPTRVGRVRTKQIDRDLLDGEEAGAGHADLTREAATHSSRPSIGMRQAVNARPTPSGRASPKGRLSAGYDREFGRLRVERPPCHIAEDGRNLQAHLAQLRGEAFRIEVLDPVVEGPRAVGFDDHVLFQSHPVFSVDKRVEKLEVRVRRPEPVHQRRRV